MADIFDLDAKILGILLSYPNVLNQTRKIITPGFFHDKYRRPMRRLIDYFDKYGSVPPIDILEIPLGMTVNDKIENLNEEYAVNEIAQFIKHRAFEFAALEAPNHLHDDYRKSDFHKIFAAFEAANNIDLNDEDNDVIYGDEIGTIEPPSYLVAGWLIKNTVTAIYGAPGTFKSFFILNAALELATRGVPIWYVAAEGPNGINLRTEAWLQNHQKKLNAKDFALKKKPVLLNDAASVSAFIAQVKRSQDKFDIKYGLVVIDTLSQCAPGADENSAQDMSLVTSNMIRIRRELDTTVVFVHHTGKDQTKEMRGSSAVKANTDGMIEIRRNNDDMEGSAVVRRQKDGPIGQMFTFDMPSIEIPRLQGTILSNSLICNMIPAADKKLSLMSQLANQKLFRDIVSTIGANKQISIHQLNLALGHANCTFSKKKLLDLFPLDQPINVNMGKDIHMTLTRTDVGGKGYGDVTCRSRSEIE